MKLEFVPIKGQKEMKRLVSYGGYYTLTGVASEYAAQSINQWIINRNLY